MKKLIFVIAAVALIASPALAVDWNFYGSARMATFYQSRDFKDSTPSDFNGGTLGAGKTEDQETVWDLQGNSRLGATVKGENVGGRFEFGVNEDTITSRRLFGTWNFGAATLKVGKDYTPVKQFVSGQAFDGDIGLLGRGAAYGSRHGQVALSFGGFEVALIENTSGLLRGMTDGNIDELVPKIEAAFGMSFDTWNFKVIGGYQYYKIKDAGVLDNDESVKSWTLGADAGVNFGPAYIKGAISGGTNVGDAGWHITKGTNTAGWDGSNSKDVDTIQGLIAVGFKFTDKLSFEGGIGYRYDDSDLNFEDKDEDIEAYIQAVISLAPGVTIIPEIGYTDYKDDLTDLPTGNQDEGDRYYVGAKWQIDF